ncbi:MAG: hypothetical protein JWN32_1852 [Solirubrobacterales bacterium]|nr:hypothetical protein [Solirubrobacterales bacterium]
MHQLDAITIRLSGPEDAQALYRLAALDSAEVPSGWMLLAEVGDEPWAAVEVRSGQAIADPFRPTADIVELLRMRAARLRGDDESTRGRSWSTLRPKRSRRALPSVR